MHEQEFPWPACSATGLGSHPGDDPWEALRAVIDELPDLPYLPELPARGPGATIVGRGAALLVDLAAEWQPAGWRLADRPDRDLRRAGDLLRRDLDALEEVAGDYSGPLKVQATGPWSLAASLELRGGAKVLADAGAVRDLAASLAEGLAGYLDGVRRRVPGARLLLQLDEPSLPHVLAGAIPTASGLTRLPPADQQVVAATLRDVITTATEAGAFPLVHCCAAEPPIALVHSAGARAVSVDLGRLRTASLESLGAAVDSGAGLLAGVVPATDIATDAGSGAEMSGSGSTVTTATFLRQVWRRLGFAPEQLATTTVVTPTCGFAGASSGYARTAMARCRDVARAVYESPQG